MSRRSNVMPFPHVGPIIGSCFVAGIFFCIFGFQNPTGFRIMSAACWFETTLMRRPAACAQIQQRPITVLAPKPVDKGRLFSNCAAMRFVTCGVEISRI